MWVGDRVLWEKGGVGEVGGVEKWKMGVLFESGVGVDMWEVEKGRGWEGWEV